MSDEPRSGERRGFYRLPYPPAERPTLWVGNGRYEVVELSETGARVLVGAGLPQSGPVAGSVQFGDGELVPIEGTVLRVEGSQAVLRLSVGVSLRRMLDERRRLLRRYPTLFDESRGKSESG